MDKNLISHLPQGETATIVTLHGGCVFQNRLRGFGITEGKKVRMVAKHPLSGPLVLEVEHRQVTIGRGMAQKIQVVRES
jgi:ferrous iron transport protein A